MSDDLILQDELPQRFEVGGIVEVLLPSGTRMRGTRPTVRTVDRLGKLTPELRDAASHLGDVEWNADPANLAKTVALMDLMVSLAPRAILGPDGWERVDLSPEDVASMDPVDVGVIEDLIFRQLTPEEVTAASERLIALQDAPVDEPDPGAPAPASPSDDAAAEDIT